MRISPLFVRLSQLATQAAERMPHARAALIQSTCSEAASMSGDTSITSGACSRRKSTIGRHTGMARSPAISARSMRVHARRRELRDRIEPVIGRRQHLPLDPRAQRRRAGEARVQVAHEIHDAAQAVRDRAPRAFVLRDDAEHAHAVGVRLQSLEPHRLLGVGVDDRNRHVVAARRQLLDRRNRRSAGIRASPRRTGSS